MPRVKTCDALEKIILLIIKMVNVKCNIYELIITWIYTFQVDANELGTNTRK